MLRPRSIACAFMWMLAVLNNGVAWGADRYHGGSAHKRTNGIVMPKTRHAIPEVQELIGKAPTLSDLILGRARGRSSAEQKSCFLNLVGIGLQFAAVGSVLYRKAVAAGRGHDLPTDRFTEDVVP